MLHPSYLELMEAVNQDVPEGEAEIHWALPAQPNYFPPIDAVEVQIKQNKFFDSWRTVETLKSSTRGPEPEDEAKQRIEAIRFDRKCGNVEPMEKKVEELAEILVVNNIKIFYIPVTLFRLK